MESLTGTTPEPKTYRGRFAPSPTGPLHLGSLVAAVASYLDARFHGGLWLVRMEDVDTVRCVPGMDDTILRQLEAYGLHWDETVVTQSQRGELYKAALRQLVHGGHAYPCTCPRKIAVGRYPGLCRNGPVAAAGPHAWRVRVPNLEVSFEDRFTGLYSENIWETSGDFVVRRRDRLWAYQLAVTVDDFAQGITDIIRGQDLLDATPRQDYLRQLLGYPAIRHGHIPLVNGPTGQKLSKQNFARAIECSSPEVIHRNLLVALNFLGYHVPDGEDLTAAELLLHCATQPLSPPAVLATAAGRFLL